MAQWLTTHQRPIFPWMCDHYGHLNVRYFAHLFDDASFAMWPLVGVGMDVLAAAGVHTVVARTETDFRAEVRPGRVVSVESRLERVGTKSVGYEQQLLDVETQNCYATQRAVEVFFDPGARISTDIPDDIRRSLEAALAA